jgi:hypothetical protein
MKTLETVSACDEIIHSDSDFPVGGRSNSYRQAMLLESVNSHVDEEHREDVYHVALALCSLLKDAGLDMSEDEVERAIYMIQCNAHSKFLLF